MYTIQNELMWRSIRERTRGNLYTKINYVSTCPHSLINTLCNSGVRRPPVFFIAQRMHDNVHDDNYINHACCVVIELCIIPTGFAVEV